MKEVKGGGIDHVSQKKGPFAIQKHIVWALHASWKIKQCILENHSSWLLWKSRFMREKKYPFHISRVIKRADHRSQKYPFHLHKCNVTLIYNSGPQQNINP